MSSGCVLAFTRRNAQKGVWMRLIKQSSEDNRNAWSFARRYYYLHPLFGTLTKMSIMLWLFIIVDENKIFRVFGVILLLFCCTKINEAEVIDVFELNVVNNQEFVVFCFLSTSVFFPVNSTNYFLLILNVILPIDSNRYTEWSRLLFISYFFCYPFSGSWRSFVRFVKSCITND